MVVRDNGILHTPTILAAGVGGRNASVYTGNRPDRILTVNDPLAVSPNPLLGDSVENNLSHKIVSTQIERDNGVIQEAATVGYETWFESFHVIPRSFEFGNLLSTQMADVEIYSAFRRDDHDWTAFTNNAGAGVTLSGLPSLPHTFVPQSDGGLDLEIEASTSGQAVVASTLVYEFGTVPQTTLVPITLERVVLFAIQPELPYTEKLQWFTDVLGHVDGTEQRLSPRKNPRQLFSWDFFMEDGAERAYFSNVLFDWQARTFGIPIWHELTRTTAPILAEAITINVRSTDYADYRIGGLAVIFTSRTTFDVLEILSLTATTITFVSGTINAYAQGALVMPLRVGSMKRLVGGSRFVSADARLKVEFRIEDNDSNLADISAWSTFNSKVLIDGCNSVRSQMSEQFERDIVLFDNTIGIAAQTSPWDVGKRISQLALLAKGKEGLWDVRQLLYALRGKQISFYSSTFSKDIVLSADISAGNLLTIENVGYTRFVQSRQPRNVIRIVYNDGTADDIRTILSSVEDSATVETLTLDSTVSAHLASVVEKVMFIEKVRWDTDEITIRHEIGDTTTRITGPVKTVLE